MQNTLTYNQPVSANYANYAITRTIGASITAAGGLTLVTDKDFAAEAAQVKAGGALDLLARGSVTIGAGQDEVMSETMTTKKSSGLLSSKKTTDYEYADVKTTVASAFSGETVNVAANGDLTLKGSSITGNGDVALAAGGAIDILATQDVTTTESIRTKKISGLMGAVDGGIGISIGTKKSSDTRQQTVVSNIASLVGSLGGNVAVAAGGDLTSTGSMIEALAGNLSLAGQNLALSAALDTASSYAAQSESFSGLSVSVGGGGNNPITQAQQAATFLSAASKTKDSKAKVLYEAAAAMQTAQGVLNLANGGLASLASIGIKIGFGSESSRTESWQTSQQASGGQAIAGGTLDMQAAGDLTLTGATVKAADVLLAAERDLVLRSLALTDTSSIRSTSSSSFVGVSVDWSLSSGVGIGIVASASGSNGQSQSTQTNHAQTNVTGSNSVDLTAGRDATLSGAEVLGQAITAAIGRDLTIVSDQDSASQSASQSSWSASGSIGVSLSSGGVSGSASYSQNQGKASGSYLSVTTPSGLFAGAGGFDVSVGGTTALTGAALASEADAAQNILTTGALLTANLQNAATWSATSSGFGFSLSTRGIPMPSMSPTQKGSGSDASTAYAAIANAQLTITNPALQQALTDQTPAEVIAALNRDAANTNRALSTLPDLAQVLRNQADVAAAQTAATQAATQLIGAPLAKAIGDAAKAGEIDTAAQFIAHAMLGCALGAISGQCGAGALGAVTGEAVGQALLQNWVSTQLQAIQNGTLDPAQFKQQYAQFAALGADVAALAAGLVGFAAGGTGGAGVASLTGDNAAANNNFALAAPSGATLAGLAAACATSGACTAAAAATAACVASVVCVITGVVLVAAAGGGWYVYNQSSNNNQPGIGHNGGPSLDGSSDSTPNDPNQQPPLDPAAVAIAAAAAAGTEAAITAANTPADTCQTDPNCDPQQHQPRQLLSQATYEIGQSDGGPGSWATRNEGLSAAEAAYQQKVTGAPRGTVYNVPNPEAASGITSFDGYNPATNTLIDAKLWKNWPIEAPFSQDSVTLQALQQIRAAEARGANIEWFVPSTETAAKLNTLFQGSDIRLQAIKITVKAP